MKFSWIRKTCALLLAILLTACLCACSGDGDSDTSSAQTSSGTSGDGKTLEARLITPVYESLDTIVAVADVVADYGADPTGKADSTRAIRQALIKVAFAGGGTVWMPKGTYHLSYEQTAGTAGRMISGICTIQSQLAPELTAHSAGTRLTVE